MACRSCVLIPRRQASRAAASSFSSPAAQDEMFSAAMFDFLDALKAKGKKVETVGLFFEDTIFGTDSSNVQRKLAAERGYKLVADIKYKSNSPSLSVEVQQLKSADPDVLLPSSYVTDAILLMRTMSELGYKPKNIVAQASGFSDKSFYDAIGDKAVAVISRASFSLDMAQKRPSVLKVNDMYKARSNRDLNDSTSRELMGLLVLADAIDRAKSTDGEKIREALAATDIPGERTIMPWKRVKFEADGQNVDADPVLVQYIGGTFVTIFPAAVALAEPLWPMNVLSRARGLLAPVDASRLFRYRVPRRRSGSFSEFTKLRRPQCHPSISIPILAKVSGPIAAATMTPCSPSSPQPMWPAGFMPAIPR